MLAQPMTINGWFDPEGRDEIESQAEKSFPALAVSKRLRRELGYFTP